MRNVPFSSKCFRIGLRLTSKKSYVTVLETFLPGLQISLKHVIMQVPVICTQKGVVGMLALDTHRMVVSSTYVRAKLSRI